MFRMERKHRIIKASLFFLFGYGATLVSGNINSSSTSEIFSTKKLKRKTQDFPNGKKTQNNNSFIVFSVRLWKGSGFRQHQQLLYQLVQPLPLEVPGLLEGQLLLGHAHRPRWEGRSVCWPSVYVWLVWRRALPDSALPCNHPAGCLSEPCFPFLAGCTAWPIITASSLLLLWPPMRDSELIAEPGSVESKNRLNRIHKFCCINHTKIEIVLDCQTLQKIFVHFDAGNDLSLKILTVIVLNMVLVVAASTGNISQDRCNQCDLMTSGTQLAQPLAITKNFFDCRSRRCHQGAWDVVGATLTRGGRRR
jgi:hypothetical protein